MTNIVQPASWADVPLLETTTAVLGGDGGPMNFQAKALVARSEFLDDKIDALDGSDIANTPSGTISSITVQGAINELEVDVVSKVSSTTLSASSGASLVGYMPDGVGAVATNVQAQLRKIQTTHLTATDAPFYCVGDYTGVSGAGTDNTAKLQAFIDAGGTRLPAGRYRITGSLTMRFQMQLFGSGEYNTIIEADGAFPIFINDPATTPDFARCNFSSLTLRGGTYAHKYTLTGVNVQSLGDWAHVRFENQTIRAIDADQFFMANNLYNCVFSYCGGAVQCGKFTSINNFIACRFEGMSTNTIVFLDGSSVGSVGVSRGGEVNNFIGCRFEARKNPTDSGYTVAILKSCISTVFQGCYFEDTWKTILHEENATTYNSTVFRDCKFSGQEVSVVPAGAKPEKFNSTGIVSFENNFFEVGSDGTSTASLRLSGRNSGLNTVDTRIYQGLETQDSGAATTKPWTPVTSTPKNLLTVTRTDLTNSVNNRSTVGGTIIILMNGFDSGGNPFSLKRDYPFNVIAYTNATMSVVVGTPVTADSNGPGKLAATASSYRV